jgi:hypothetical protein
MQSVTRMRVVDYASPKCLEQTGGGRPADTSVNLTQRLFRRVEHFRVSFGSLERRYPRDVLADDQGMDVVGALVGFY